MAATAAVASPEDPDCGAARVHYESLAFREALAAVDRASPLAPSCLEVRALVLMALGRQREAETTLWSLFARWPDHPVDQRALSPSDRAFIDRIRADARPLSIKLGVEWQTNTALRLRFELQGGLRGADRLRYRARLGPTEALGRAPIVDRVATAVLDAPSTSTDDGLRLQLGVLDRVGRIVHEQALRATLPPRPTPAVADDDDGWPWWVWAVGAAVVVGATVTTVVLVQPGAPDASGTLGRVEVP